MQYKLTVAALILLATLAASCNRNKVKQDDPHRRSEMKMDDDYETSPPRNTVSEVMRSKLAHAQAVLEGISLADFALIETNVRVLKEISETGEWLAHESPSYFRFSADFRSACDRLLQHAQRKDLAALTTDYNALTNSCVACHTYLRQERPYLNMPGRISMR